MKIKTALMIAMVIVAAASVAAQDLSVARPLVTGQTIEVELKGGETHAYSLSLRQGEFLRVEVKQRGIDVVVTLQSISGAELVKVNLLAEHGTEQMSYEALEAGNYRLEVTAAVATATSGRYSLVSTISASATTLDKERLAAERLLMEVEILKQAGGVEKLQEAIAKSEPNIARWRKLDDKYWLGYALNQLGILYSDLGLAYYAMREQQKTLDSHREALRLFIASGNRSGEAAALNNIGLFYREAGELHKALDYYKRALSLYKNIKEPGNEANTLTNIGYVYEARGEKQRANDYFRQSVALYRASGNLRTAIEILNKIGSIQWASGNKQKAIESFQQILPLWKAVGDRAGEATALFNLGWYYLMFGEKRKAQKYFNQALALHRIGGDRVGEARRLDNIGRAYDDSANSQEASKYYQQSLTLSRAIGDKRGEAFALYDIGIIYHRLGKRQKANEYYEQSLPLWRAADDKQGEANVLFNLGRNYLSLGNRQKALRYYTQALPLYRLVKDKGGEIQTLNEAADLNLSLGEKLKAIELYQQAAQLQQAIGDKQGAATTLIRISDIYNEQGDPQKKLEFDVQALPLLKATGDRTREAETLYEIGDAYHKLKQYQTALGYFRQAASIWGALGERGREAEMLGRIAGTYAASGDKESSIEPMLQALPLYHAIGDHAGKGLTLTMLGLTYYFIGDKQMAWKYLREVLPLLKYPDLRDAYSGGLINAPLIFLIYEDNQKVLEYYEQVLTFSKGNHRLRAAALANIGRIHSLLEDNEKALHHFQQALAFYRKASDRNGEAAVLNEIGTVYVSRRTRPASLQPDRQDGENPTLDADQMRAKLQRVRAFNQRLEAYLQQMKTNAQRAKEIFRRALTLYQAVKNRRGESVTLTNIGIAYHLLDDNQGALNYYQRALSLAEETHDRQAEQGALYRLMTIWTDLSNPRLAILFGKRAINSLQSLRAEISQIDKEMGKSFVRLTPDPYRELASLLIEQGRLMEAEQVLAMLKAEEFFDYVRRDGGEAKFLTANISFTPQEAELEKRYRAIADRLPAIGVEYDALLMKRPRTPAEEQKLARLEKDLETAREAFQVSLDRIAAELAKSKDDAKKYEVIREAQGLQETLRELGDGAVALYTVVSEDKYRLILITPSREKAYEYPIKAAELNCKVFAFRSVLQSPGQDPLPLARELYRILIGPELAADLEQSQARTLMWSLDGTLRYLPIAALHDGQQYLVEKYRNVVFTPLLTSNLNKEVSQTWTGLGLGVSKKYQGFSSLPAVPAELDGIIKDETDANDKTGALNGRIMLDETFTEETMKTALRQRYPLVHIASHFSFRPGNETDSFLLLGDGTHLDVAGIKKLSFGGVELLTLSACDTATGGSDGNGKEVEGFSMLAQRQGAKAVLATLWPVADDSTRQFMEEFYRWRQANPQATKVEAVQAAQLFLMSGKTNAPANRQRTAPDSFPLNQCATEQPPFEADEKRPFAHPYYWAPFVLIGNWR